MRVTNQLDGSIPSMRTTSSPAPSSSIGFLGIQFEALFGGSSVGVVKDVSPRDQFLYFNRLALASMIELAFWSVWGKPTPRKEGEGGGGGELGVFVFRLYNSNLVFMQFEYIMPLL